MSYDSVLQGILTCCEWEWKRPPVKTEERFLPKNEIKILEKKLQSYPMI